MLEIEGDFWQENSRDFYQAIVCPTNCMVNSHNELVMGAGLALDFRKRYTFLPQHWGARPRGSLIATYYPVSEQYLIALPTKNHFKHPSTLDLIIPRVKELVLLTNILGWDRVLLPRLGCGLGGLKWVDVKPRLTEHLDDRFVVIERKI